MSDTYTISQLAERLSVSTSTIRRFSEDFTELLPDYEHVRGRVRSFSEADVRHLRALFTKMDSRPHSYFRRKKFPTIDDSIRRSGQVSYSCMASLPQNGR